jgi:hypothetical protein
MSYGNIVSNGGALLGKGMPAHWIIGFEIDYDNVPPLKTRTTEQRLQATLTSFTPPAWGNVILFRDER